MANRGGLVPSQTGNRYLGIAFNDALIPSLFGGELSRTCRYGGRTLREINKRPDDWAYGLDRQGRHLFTDLLTGKQETRRGPYGEPGEPIYLQESFRPVVWRDAEPLRLQYRCDRRTRQEIGYSGASPERYVDWRRQLVHDATRQVRLACNVEPLQPYSGPARVEPHTDRAVKFRPASQLPWWGTRLALTNVGKTCRRIQDIAEMPRSRIAQYGFGDTVDLFARTWDALHGAGAWQRNEWVWDLTLSITVRFPTDEPARLETLHRGEPNDA